jgi:hypothetical protein
MIGGRKNQSQDQPDAKEKSPETAGKEMGTGKKIPEGGYHEAIFGEKFLKGERTNGKCERKRNKNSEIFARKEGDEDLMYGIWYNGNKYCLSRERKNIISGRG